MHYIVRNFISDRKDAGTADSIVKIGAQVCLGVVVGVTVCFHGNSCAETTTKKKERVHFSHFPT